MRTMERRWQVIIMCVRNNVITEAGSLTRLIGKGVSQLITLDPHSIITLSSICSLQHESWPHPLSCQSCQQETPTLFLNLAFPHSVTCSLQEKDQLFILQPADLSVLLILIWIDIISNYYLYFILTLQLSINIIHYGIWNWLATRRKLQQLNNMVILA